MKHAPLSFLPDLFESLDLGTISASLLAKAHDASDGRAARTLLKGPSLTVVLMAMRSGARLAEHAAPGPLLVLPLHGDVVFSRGDGEPGASLREATALAVGPGLRHEVHATSDASFLLVIGARSP